MTKRPSPSTPLRVLIAAESYAPSVNGVSNSVARVQRHLTARGHSVIVVAPSPGPDEVDGVQVVRVPSRSLPFYRNVPVGLPPSPLIEHVLDRFEPDVVHLAAPVVLGARVAAAAAARDLPSVSIFQTDLSGFARAYGLGTTSSAVWWWLRRLHRLADVTLAPSTATADELIANRIPRVGIWGRGVDHEQFDPRRRSQVWRRSVLGADTGQTIIGYVGRLAREKRIDLLRGVDRWPDTKLVVVGDGPQRSELSRALPGAHFTGLLRGEELATAMASLDVFVHTGAHETFCQAVQEAMASGLPVVAPASGGPLDLVDHGRTGLLFRPDDAASLRHCVRTLTDDPSKRAAMGHAGADRTVGRTWERVGDELVDAYVRCIDSRRRPNASVDRPSRFAVAG